MKPIIFSTPMVQAILEGRKTQTRRIIKSRHESGLFRISRRMTDNAITSIESLDWDERNCEKDIICPYGRVGDILYVRETFRHYHPVDEYGYTKFDQDIYEFAADNPPMIPQVDADGAQEFNKDGCEKFIPWKPCIHMPQKIARLFLKITDIRVERLQDISEADAKAEGVCMRPFDDPIEPQDFSYCPNCGGQFVHGAFGENYGVTEVDCTTCDTYKKRFKILWGQINGPESWDANPWVWVINFERIEKPE